MFLYSATLSCHCFSLCSSTALVEKYIVTPYFSAFAGALPTFFIWLTFVDPSRFRCSHISFRKPSRESCSWAQSPSHRFLFFFTLSISIIAVVSVSSITYEFFKELKLFLIHFRISRTQPNLGTKEVLRCLLERVKWK